MAVRHLTDTEIFLLTTPDDTEDAPWMVMDDLHVRDIDVLKAILSRHIARRTLVWYIASYLKITKPRPGSQRPLEAAPDLLVARASDDLRTSWRVETEGKAPEFVLEVVSASSLERDTEDKPEIYDWMGVDEYAIFLPERRGLGPKLSGYRRDGMGRFVPWEPDARGVLQSAVLGLGMYVEGRRWLRALDAQGRRLPTPWEAEEAETAARLEAERRIGQETAARLEAERRVTEMTEELARLREQLRRRQEGGA